MVFNRGNYTDVFSGFIGTFLETASQRSFWHRCESQSRDCDTGTTATASRNTVIDFDAILGRASAPALSNQIRRPSSERGMCGHARGLKCIYKTLVCIKCLFIQYRSLYFYYTFSFLFIYSDHTNIPPSLFDTMHDTSAPAPAYLRQDVKSSQPPAIVGMSECCIFYSIRSNKELIMNPTDLQSVNDEKGSHKCESGDKCQHKANRLRGGGAARVS